MSRRRTLAWFADNERALWLAGLACYGVGDTATTMWGLSTVGVAETGLLAAPLIDAHGRVAMLTLKLVTIGAFSLVWRALERPARVAVPLALLVVGAFVTGWNLFVIAVASG